MTERKTAHLALGLVGYVILEIILALMGYIYRFTEDNGKSERENESEFDTLGKREDIVVKQGIDQYLNIRDQD